MRDRKYNSEKLKHIEIDEELCHLHRKKSQNCNVISPQIDLYTESQSRFKFH